MTTRIHPNSAKTHCPHGHPYIEGNVIWDKTHTKRKCAECHRQTAREYYHRRRARFREANEDAWREKIREKDRRFEQRHPEKERTHRIVTAALRNGTLDRPTACEDCGKTCTPEASHDDYSKPLEVEWLCRQCHAIKDRKHKAVVDRENRRLAAAPEGT